MTTNRQPDSERDQHLEPDPRPAPASSKTSRPWPHPCDRCGSQMHERNCKVICPNCGNRFDCSDLNLYFD